MLLIPFEQVETSGGCQSKNNLNNQQRWAIYGALMERSVEGKLKKNYNNGGCFFIFSA